MAESNEELRKIINQQADQIKTLKQALLRLEKQVKKVATVAERAQGQARRNQENIQIINHKIGKR